MCVMHADQLLYPPMVAADYPGVCPARRHGGRDPVFQEAQRARIRRLVGRLDCHVSCSWHMPFGTHAASIIIIIKMNTFSRWMPSSSLFEVVWESNMTVSEGSLLYVETNTQLALFDVLP